MKALVKIMPKKGVLDPQGKAIEKSLNQLGFSQISSVIQGKLIEIEIDSINENDAQKIVEDAKLISGNRNIETIDTQSNRDKKK